MEIWNICEEITSKKDWYSKVFQSTTVAKWQAELPLEAAHNFTLALKLLRASAQGVKHEENCDWGDTAPPLCDECKRATIKMLREDGEEIDSDDDEWMYDDDFRCDHPRCQCIPPDSSLDSYIRYHPEGLIDSQLHTRSQELIGEIANHEPIDWHPVISQIGEGTPTAEAGSGQQVRDLIHPSMYCYVKGVSKHTDGTVSPAVDESVRYQWLPSEFKIGDRVEVTSYINNLDSVKYPRMTPLIEEVFMRFLPSLEAVLKRPLSGRNLQVIVKVGSIELTPEKPLYPGGSWHIEGMPYEQIAATCIHYVDVRGITDSFLEFRKPTIIHEEELDYPQSDTLFTEHHYGVVDHHDGLMNRYLGLVKCHEGASVVFPNTLQHRVKEFRLAPGASAGLRTILAFFVIDPDHPIVSTKEVPPQQGLFSRAEAERHRERLMVHRKYFISQLNEVVFERPFSLCEH